MMDPADNELRATFWLRLVRSEQKEYLLEMSSVSRMCRNVLQLGTQ